MTQAWLHVIMISYCLNWLYTFDGNSVAAEKKKTIYLRQNGRIRNDKNNWYTYIHTYIHVKYAANYYACNTLTIDTSRNQTVQRWLKRVLFYFFFSLLHCLLEIIILMKSVPHDCWRGWRIRVGTIIGYWTVVGRLLVKGVRS